MTTDTQPQGRSMKELRQIIAASNARLDRIHEVWDELTDAEQERLAKQAEEMRRDG